MIRLKKSIKEIKKRYKKHILEEKQKIDNESAFVVPAQQLLSMQSQQQNQKDEKKEKEQKKAIEGIDLKTELSTKPKIAIATSHSEGDEEYKKINISYPLIIDEKTNKVMAYAEIKYNPKIGKLVYNVIEPPLNLQDIKNITYIKKIIENKIDTDISTLGQEEVKDYIDRMIENIIQEFNLKLSPEKIEIYKYYIKRDFLGLGKIEPLMQDKNLEDISCDGVNIPIFVFHRDPNIGSIQTNVMFNKKEELDNFIIKLAQKCEKNISVSEPLLEGALKDGSRVHGVLGTDIARKGSNFTIRKFSKEPLTPIKLMQYNTIDSKTLAYLWLMIENKLSVLVSGPTAAGKTSLLNALSMFINPTAKIVSIEDTPELRLMHPHWVPEVERPGFGTYRGGKRVGEVTMFDLLKGALRQRPDYIIVGEVRGQEAYVLFQGMATGHAGLATIHADSIEKVLDRLVTPPINLPPSLLETLDAVVFVKGFRYKDKFVRRITNIHEIEGYDIKTSRVKDRKTVEWNSKDDKFEFIDPSIKLKKISFLTGLSKEEIIRELQNRIYVLEWMKENNIIEFNRVNEIIKAYYFNKEELLDFISEER